MLLPFVLMLGLVSAGVAAAEDQTPPPPDVTPLRFVPLPPCRAADTRLNNPPLPATLVPGIHVTLPLAGKCGIPASAKAYSLNVTAVPQGPLSYLTVWPSGEPQPVASLLNSWTGTPVAVATIVRAGTGGAVNVFLTELSHFVVDVNGYFIESSADLALFPLTPCRLLDTRTTATPLATGETRRLDLLGKCGIPATAQAYSLNVTAVAGNRTLGHVTLFPTGQARPEVSTLNAWNGGTVANAALVPSGNGGSIEVFASDATDLVIDINGYFAPYTGDGALSLFIRPPCRILDTRQPAQGFTGTLGPPVLGTGETREVNFRASTRCSVPQATITAKPEPLAFLMHTTVVPKAQLGYLTLWPSGIGMPLASTLNSTLIANATSNMAIVPAGVEDRIQVYASDETHLVIDLSGWFANTWR